MRKRRMYQILIIVICLFITVFTIIIHARKLKTAESFSLDKLMGGTAAETEEK